MIRVYVLILLIFSVKATYSAIHEEKDSDYVKPAFVQASLPGPTEATLTIKPAQRIRDTSYVCLIQRVRNQKKDKLVFSGSLIQTSLGQRAILSTANIFHPKVTGYVAVFGDGISRKMQDVVFYRDIKNAPESIALGFLDSYPESAKPLTIGTYDEVKEAGYRHICDEVAGHEVQEPGLEGFFFPVKGQLSAYAPPLRNKAFLNSRQNTTYFERLSDDFELKTLDRHLYSSRFSKRTGLINRGRYLLSCLFCTTRFIMSETFLNSFSPPEPFVPLTIQPKAIALLGGQVQNSMIGSTLVLEDTNHAIALLTGHTRENHIYKLFYRQKIFILASVLMGCALGGHYLDDRVAYGVMIPFSLWLLYTLNKYFSDPYIKSTKSEEYALVYHLKDSIDQVINSHYGV